VSGSPPGNIRSGEPVFWRVEGSLLNLTAVRPVGFFAWNAQSFLERWTRRGAMGLLALARPVLYCTHRVAATRILHTVLRGVSQDRLDLLGEEYFEYVLKPRLKQAGVEKLQALISSGARVVLVSQGLDHIMRPLAAHLGIDRLISNRLEFRNGLATGRLLDPVIRPRGALAKLTGSNPNGRISRKTLAGDLGFPRHPEYLDAAIRPAHRSIPRAELPVVYFDCKGKRKQFSVRQSLRGKNILLIGATGFIGKVWLSHLLTNVPEIGKVYLLIRPSRSLTALGRFERMVERSPVFEPLAQRHGSSLADFLREKVEVIAGDATQPDLGIAPDDRVALQRSLDLIVNSSGLTDFNPDLRDAITSNVRALQCLLDFLKGCDHAGLLHLSTCYVVGMRDGRVLEELQSNYSPKHIAGFDAVGELESLETLIRDTEARAESAEVTETLRQRAMDKSTASKDLQGSALENQIRKNRLRWLRQELTEAGTRRANQLGWPNTYTLTKSVAESLIKNFIDSQPDIPVSVVRPAIVESSVKEPFLGWNEGINTSASLSYLLGTYFRQLPTNERKCLDLVPVDLVARGMTLISAALLSGSHSRIYHLATSVSNPCNMRRSIELTGLGHRRHYRAQVDFKHRVKLKFDAIPVSKARYENLSAPAQRALVQTISRTMGPIPFAKQPLAKIERELERVIKLIALFEPFILHNDHIFEAANIERLSAALPTEERNDFGYDSRSIDWWDYWINVHIPALRKWCYPLIEGHPQEHGPLRQVRLRPEVPVATEAESTASAASP
jgi:thioester reductase-like protein